jgi:hypothetical protein
MTLDNIAEVRTPFFIGSAAFACCSVLAALPSFAAAADYRFELVGEPQLSAGHDIVHIRLMHVTDGTSVPDAVIVESTGDMGSDDMPTMPAPMKKLSVKCGVYAFDVDPTMVGRWALHLAAEVRGEPETIRGTVEADLAK